MAATNVTLTEDQLYALPMEDLRKLDMDAISKAASEEAARASATPSNVDPAASVDDPPANVDPAAEPIATKRVYQAERTIDLGDGAGVQVFRATGDTELKAERALTDKLAQAQTNATRKIRELSAQHKTVTAEDKNKALADEALISNEMLSRPSDAVKKIFKDATGLELTDVKEIAQTVRQDRAARERKAIADQFVVNHPEFVDNDRNAARLKKAVALQGTFSLENLEKAYQDLNESGLLEVKAADASVGQETEEEKAQRIAASSQADASSQRTKKSSGLSTQRKTATPPPAVPSEDDLYKMPLDELRKRANQQLSSH